MSEGQRRGMEFGYKDPRLSQPENKGVQPAAKKERKNTGKTGALILAALAYFGPTLDRYLDRHLNPVPDNGEDFDKQKSRTVEAGTKMELTDVNIETLDKENILSATVNLGSKKYNVKVSTSVGPGAEFVQEDMTATLPDQGEPIRAKSLVVDPGHGTYMVTVFAEVPEGLLVRTVERDDNDKVVSSHSTIIAEAK